ncbi:helix-turn-helix domain-containing protein [Segniliparus rugosus]|uniref:Excisionase family DNA binding domain-containing protein n=1 Tax=Segniliparus rugosus (strain ATCC BAA-974 / DSM 45345 / CCUG 50838 / CIP 108380 / JCM 13579 / CDC 945) TaxID=679197 RepID=E5XNC7_SEGRC|nr:helix-turn-helix domain-containing protein [Segniliparus rugosus]EFV14136.1 excisionase family DNA binding domain-containing protein [Segniliparus rugosus ATCC BAA-974]
MQDAASQRLYPIQAARTALGGISTTTVYELVKQGEITKVNIGRRGFITANSINAYIERLAATASGSMA